MSESLPSSSDKFQEGISRRSFLKKSGGVLLGGATLAGNPTGVLEERAAQATEVLEGMSWREGVLKLREDVMNSKVETSAIFVEHSDRSYWTYPGDEEEKKTTRDPRIVIARERDKGASNIKRAHAHTLSDAKTLVEGGEI
jgi:hypothetical protein